MYIAVQKAFNKIVVYLESQGEVAEFFDHNNWDNAFWLGSKERTGGGKKRYADTYLIQGWVVEVWRDEEDSNREDSKKP